jgi:hypothetical protein
VLRNRLVEWFSLEDPLRASFDANEPLDDLELERARQQTLDLRGAADARVRDR